jgi:hypothetical protein
VIAELEKTKQAQPAPSKTGGKEITPSLTREQLLREVYRYKRDNSSVYATNPTMYRDEIEDNNAGVVKGLEWVPGYLVDNFAEHIKKDFDTDGKHPFLD